MYKLVKGEYIKNINSFIKRNENLQIKSDTLDGFIVIKRVRVYTWEGLLRNKNEVDIEFNGKVAFKYVTRKNKEWYDSTCSRNSNVQTNRIIRREVFLKVRNYLNLFGVNLNQKSDIKKVVWK